MKKLSTLLIILFSTISLFAQNDKQINDLKAPSIEWQKCLGGNHDEEARSIKQTNDGGYIVAGFTDSNNGDVIGNHGGRDIWIVKLYPEGNGVNESVNSTDIYPNPATNYITLDEENSESMSGIVIYDVFGERVLVAQTPSSEQKIDISNLPAGVYFVRVGNEKPLKFMKV